MLDNFDVIEAHYLKKLMSKDLHLFGCSEKVSVCVVFEKAKCTWGVMANDQFLPFCLG